MAFENWSFGQRSKGLPWPNGEDGKPIQPAFLAHLSAVDLEGQIVMSMLESEGIPVVTQYPNGGSFGRVILGFSGTGLDLYVPITRLEDAIGMMEGEIQADDEFREDDLV